MNAIEVVNLSKHFGAFKSVDSINFTVEKGSIFGFLGANGAGKSTTIKMLCGILTPTSGDAVVAGYSISGDPDSVKKNIGYMSQRFSLYNDLTIKENIEFFGGIYGMHSKDIQERKAWVLKLAGLEDRQNTLTAILPGGIKQRLALGVAVMHRPQVVFLDEPTSGVDPVSRRAFWELIHELSAGGITVLVTTHYLEEAEYCGKITFINAGRIVAEGNSASLKSSHIKNPMYEIEAASPVEVMNKLQQAAFGAEVSIFGTKVHLQTNSADVSVEDVGRFLRSELVEVKAITRINPTLEDVFITLLGEKEGK